MFPTQKDEVTLESIDFQWVQEQTKTLPLKKALRLIEQDGNYFIDLKAAVEKRLIQIDPKQETALHSNIVDPALKTEVQQEVNSWIQTPTIQKNQKMAENERNKGNEALRSNDLKEALNYYTKSIEFDNAMAASYCNRALVHLKLKDYPNVIKDCQQAISLQQDYIKAYHRRAKAHFAQKDYDKAYLDFKYIIAKEPDNSEVNGELRECRKFLTESQIHAAENQQFLQTQGAFKKVQIVEEEDDDGEMEIPMNKQQDYSKEIQSIRIKKDLISSKVQKGLYQECIHDIILLLKENQGLLDRSRIPELYEIRHQLLSNLALCHLQQQEYKSVIEYSSLILDDTDYAPSRDIVVKAHLRKALAYEHLEKLSLSKQEFMKVKQLDPGNLQASQGINRISKIMTEDEHSHYQTAVDKQAKLLEQQSQLKQQQLLQQQSIQPKQPQPIQIIQEQSSQCKLPDEQVMKQLQQYKDMGNDNFKKSQLKEAIKHWGDGIAYYEQNPSPASVQLYLTLLTNSCLCYSQLNEHQAVIDNADKAIQLEPNSIKALFRRGIAYQALSSVNDSLDGQNQQLEQSRKDLEKVVYLDSQNKQAKEKLSEVQKQNIECRIKLKQLHPERKQEQVKQVPEPQQEQEQEKVATKPQNIQDQKIQKVGENLAQTVIEDILSKQQLPETASIFERNMNTFKKGTAQQTIQYIALVSNLPQLYSKKDLPTEILLQIVNAGKLAVDTEQTKQQLITIFRDLIPATHKLDLCLKFLTKKEKAQLLELFKQIGMEQLNAVYKLV